MVRPFINRRHRRKDGGADDDLAKDRAGAEPKRSLSSQKDLLPLRKPRRYRACRSCEQEVQNVPVRSSDTARAVLGEDRLVRLCRGRDRFGSLAATTRSGWLRVLSQALHHLILQIRPQVAFVHPDRVEHADMWQLGGLAQAINGGDAHPQPARHFAGGEVRADGRGTA